MTSEAESRRFVEYVRVQLRHDDFISRESELRLVQDGLKHFHIEHGEGRWILAGVSCDMNAGLESELDRLIDGVLRRFAETDGKIKKSEFEDAVAIYASWTNGRMSSDEIARKLKARIIERGWKVGRKGLFRPRRWFNKI